MDVRHRVAFSFILFCIHLNSASGNCPENLPLEIDGNCYKLQTKLFPYSKSVENCESLADNSKIMGFMTETPEKLAKKIKDFIKKQLEKTYHWIGFYTDDTDITKPIEERKWTFDFDNSTVIQRDYNLWAQEPADSALTCAAINGSQDFKTVAVDCGGPRLPVLCMKKNDPCQDALKPFLVYGDYCFLALGPLEYNKIGGACHPDSPTPVKDKEMKKYVVNAVMNSLLGGAVFVGIKKIENFYMFDSRLVPSEMWGDGEPRENYACAGLALQMDGSVKLRTISCDEKAASLCHIRA